MKTEQDSPVKDKHLLVAVDDSESSKRAVLYVADFLGGLPGFHGDVMQHHPRSRAGLFRPRRARVRMDQREESSSREHA